MNKKKIAAAATTTTTNPRDDVRAWIDQAEAYLYGARQEVDEAWFCLEDIAKPMGEFPREDNLQNGREAVYKLLQSIAASERMLLEARRRLNRLSRPDPGGAK